MENLTKKLALFGLLKDFSFIQLSKTRLDVYGRRATINYQFEDQVLTTVIIVFLESYDKTQTDMDIRKNLYS